MTDLNEIIARCDLREIARLFLGEPKSAKGKNWEWSSPERSDSTASLKITAQFYKDFGSSDTGGGFIDFLQRYAGMSRKEAAQWLIQYDGNPTTPHIQPRIKQGSPYAPPPKRNFKVWQERIGRAVERMQSRCWETPRGKLALGYLQSRGLTMKTIIKAGLCYTGENWVTTGYTKEDGKSANIPPNAIGIPYYTFPDDTRRGPVAKVRTRHTTIKDGQPDALGRALSIDPKVIALRNPSNSKYMQVAEGDTNAVYWGMGQPPKGRPLIIVEGEFDALIVQQELGSRAGACTVGSASSQFSETALDAVAGCSGFILALDSDTAGRAATAKLTAQLKARFPDKPLISTTPPGGYKDHNDAYLAGRQNPIITPIVDYGKWWERVIVELFPVADIGIWPKGTPDNLRRAFLQIRQLVGGKVKDHAKALAVYDIIQSIGATEFTRAELQDHAQMSEASIRRACDQLVDLGLMRVKGDFSSNFSPLIVDSLLGEKFDEKSKGRPSIVYELMPIDQQIANLRANLLDIAQIEAWAKYGLLPPDSNEGQVIEESPYHAAAIADYHERRREIEAKLSGLDDDTSLSIPIDVRNGREYRGVFYAHVSASEAVSSIIDGQATLRGKTITTDERAREFGVTAPTLRKMRQDWGIKTQENWKSYQITQPDDLMAQIALLAPSAAQRPHLAGLRVTTEHQAFYLYNADRNADNLRKIEGEIAQALATNVDVFLEVQLASTELPIGFDEIEPTRRRLAIEAEQAAIERAEDDTEVEETESTTPAREAGEPTPETISEARAAIIKGVLSHKLDNGLLDMSKPAVVDLLTGYGLIPIGVAQ